MRLLLLLFIRCKKKLRTYLLNLTQIFCANRFEFVNLLKGKKLSVVCCSGTLRGKNNNYLSSDVPTGLPNLPAYTAGQGQKYNNNIK